MKNYIITVDTGTTNTRTVLLDKDRNIIAMSNREAGVRDTAIDGNNEKLKRSVRECLEEILKEASITYDEVKCIIASGMITSNVGLVEVAHLIAPAGLEELAQGIQAIELPEICPLPIWFIPGIKNGITAVTMDNFEQMDIMRGEEVESIAIMEKIESDTGVLLVLPGSHTKFVLINRENKIAAGLTSITGELISCITKNTIIADAVDRKFVSIEDYDKEMLILGYDTAQKTGLGRACFSCRILNQFVIKDKTKLANYLLGAVLQNDIMAIKNSDAFKTDAETIVVVAGKDPLKQAIYDILVHDGYFKTVINHNADRDLPLSSLGAYIVAEKRHLLQSEERI